MAGNSELKITQQDQFLTFLCDRLIHFGLLSEAGKKSIFSQAQNRRLKIGRERLKAMRRLTGKLDAAYTVHDPELIASFNFAIPGTDKPLNEDRIAQMVARDLGIPYLKLDSIKLDNQFVTKIISGPYAERHLVLPLERQGDRLVFAMANPYDTDLVDGLSKVTGLPIQRVSASKEDILKVVVEFFGFRKTMVAAQGQFSSEAVDLGNLEQYTKMQDIGEIDANEKPIVNAVWYIFQYAMDQRASDIHIEPKRDSSAIRFRIDGMLHNIHSLPKVVHTALISRIKMLARLDIAERRRPQDGRIKTSHRDQEVEMRVSTLPVAFGEKAVLRILDPNSLFIDLEELGLFPEELAHFNKFIERPNGIILVTGPTGSGKTTTLYSALSAIARPDINITTIEDPIEMVHDLFNQVAIQPKIDVTFASALRSILRQDPDVIMVGEIRDGETAEYAVQAALTGHLVFSTLHTNDTAGAITRLQDLGVIPYLISSSLVGVVGQRLVRKICVECKREVELSEAEAGVLKIKLPQGKKIKVYKGAGCARCRGTGYFGRLGIFEVLDISPKIVKLINKNADAKEIKRESVADGLITLRDHGIKKMAQGATTFEEVVRVTIE